MLVRSSWKIIHLFKYIEVLEYDLMKIKCNQPAGLSERERLILYPQPSRGKVTTAYTVTTNVCPIKLKPHCTELMEICCRLAAWMTFSTAIRQQIYVMWF
jgi:hypothetical protein